MKTNPRYKCSADFPAKIPSILRSEGLRVDLGSWMAKATTLGNPTHEFGYTISDGESSIDLTGGTIDVPLTELDDVTGFLLCARHTWKFWRRKKVSRLKDRVVESLLRSGAAVWSDYDASVARVEESTPPILK